MPTLNEGNQEEDEERDGKIIPPVQPRTDNSACRTRTLVRFSRWCRLHDVVLMNIKTHVSPSIT